jgi:hypothetical protein
MLGVQRQWGRESISAAGDIRGERSVTKHQQGNGQIDGYQWEPTAYTREEAVPVVPKFKELSTTAQVLKLHYMFSRPTL